MFYMGLTIDSSQEFCEIHAIITIFQMKKLRHEEVKELATSGHATGQWLVRVND